MNRLVTTTILVTGANFFFVKLCVCLCRRNNTLNCTTQTFSDKSKLTTIKYNIHKRTIALLTEGARQRLWHRTSKFSKNIHPSILTWVIYGRYFQVIAPHRLLINNWIYKTLSRTICHLSFMSPSGPWFYICNLLLAMTTKMITTFQNKPSLNSNSIALKVTSYW